MLSCECIKKHMEDLQIENPVLEQEHVILVDENGNDIGVAPKSTVHQGETPLHRAFSFFLFNSKKQLLLQQRAATKVTWPLVWSNSCCGHPLMGEKYEDTIKRRVKYEIGFEDFDFFEILPDFQYKATFNGVMENEVCPVWVGFSDNEPVLNPEEVNAIKWVDWCEFVKSILDPNDQKYDHLSIWCRQETKLLSESEKLDKLLIKYCK